MRRFGYLCIFLFMLSVTNVSAQVSVGEKGTLSGTVFSDYYWYAQSHNSDFNNNNGFWIRRIYLTYERALGQSFSSRLRLEMSSPGDFSTDQKMTPTVKDAYLKWSKNNHQILAGISSTPTWGLVEDVWGYRSVEKSPLDLFDFGSSRDFGLSFKGKLGGNDRVGYHFFFGNGNSNGAELNKGKKVMLSLSYKLTDKLVVEAYGDWNETADDPDARDSNTLQGFIGYETEVVNIGALYAHKRFESLIGSDSDGLDLVSLFANVTLSNNLSAFARADHLFDSNPNGPSNDYIPMSDAGEPTFLVGGIDIKLHENIHLMPNVEAVVYGEDDNGVQPDTDIMPRLTLSYSF